MEKTWENFWTTGKVEDYLSYRNSILETEKKECEPHGTSSDSNRDGAKRDAYF